MEYRQLVHGGRGPEVLLDHLTLGTLSVVGRLLSFLHKFTLEGPVFFTTVQFTSISAEAWQEKITTPSPYPPPESAPPSKTAVPAGGVLSKKPAWPGAAPRPCPFRFSVSCKIPPSAR